MVSSFDDKTQCQALDRTQPSLPMKPGRRRTMTHDYKRNGTIDLFAAMSLATGEVLHDTKRRHAGADVSASHWNHDPQPFVWPKTVDDVITKVKRGRATLDRVTESATHH